MKFVTSTVFFFAIFMFSFSQGVNAQTFQSGEQQVQLIELYTSEGCSSCPPADRWLSSLADEKELWSAFVPMAFHVDYWDYIGWKDPYASKEYSQRQRRYAAEYRETTVYTPGMRKSGEEWRSWRFLGSPEDSDAETVGKIALTVSEGGQFEAEFSASEQSDAKPSQLNVAILGVGLSNEVTRGENRGKTLEHDFVVLGISSFSSANAGKWSGVIPSPKVKAEKYAVAAWLTEGGSLTPVQATGGFLTANLN